MQRRLTTTLTAICLGGGLLLATPASSPAAGCADADTIPALVSISLDRYEASIHCLLNQERAQSGLAPLGPDSRLLEAAKGHSASMRWNGFFSHNGPGGSTFETRIVATGYIRGALSWAVGENLGYGSVALGTPRALTEAWMRSPEHRHNILDDRFREVGVGADWGSPNDPLKPLAAIVTTDFGFAGSAKGQGSGASSKKKKKRKKRKKRGR